MILYSGTTADFTNDNIKNAITEKLKISFFKKFRYIPSDYEINSWRNSLKSISDIFKENNMIDNGIILEYKMPLTSKRINCIVTGSSKSNKQNAVIIELKQWEECTKSKCENEVIIDVAGNKREILHPSVQVGNYKNYLEDIHTLFDNEFSVELKACSYLYDYKTIEKDALLDSKFNKVRSLYPIFCMDNKKQLSKYLQENIGNGEGINILDKIINGRYKTDKKLMDNVADIIKGKSRYVLLDEQQVVYDRVLSEIKYHKNIEKKKVIIVKGGPGTGKSVIAINLLADLLKEGYTTHYATGSKSFTENLRKAIGKDSENNFRYFNSYMNSNENELDVLICDESHRIRKTSNDRFTRKEKRSNITQIQELIKVAKVTVFFIDDMQLVRPDEIGSSSYIKNEAKKLGCHLWEIELKAQFRCKGSEGFINWIENTLDIRPTANIIWNNTEDEFDFKIFNSPEEMEIAIREKANKGETARIVAGFCWPWSKKPDENGELIGDIIIGDYIRPWNARYDATRLKKGIPKAHMWANNSEGINQIGCIYSVQGFEFDYIGVIIGKDLTYDLDEQNWIGNKEKSFDNVVKKAKHNFTELIKNTYRVLLSRGIKGCYVYFEDKDTERFFKSRMEE